MIDVAKTRMQLRYKCELLGIKVPEWVPERFIADFCDCAAEHGEEHAAGYVRKLKREADLSEFNRLVSRS
jgi:hypothetical protein